MFEAEGEGEGEGGGGGVVVQVSAWLVLFTVKRNPLHKITQGLKKPAGQRTMSGQK